MKLAILEPYFFSYIGYFQLINAVDKVLLYENVNFMKKWWVTRNKILMKNGEPVFINIPVYSQSSNKRISEIKIFKGEKWKSNLVRKLYFNYKRSEHFGSVFDEIKSIIETDAEYLHTYNSLTISKICKLLEIDTIIETDNSKYLELEDQLFKKYGKCESESPSTTSSRRTERVIQIAQSEKSKIYINGIGGTSLYKKSEFANSGIDLFFLKTNDFTYSQLSRKFFSHLSIIDVLFNCGIEQTKALLNNFELL